MANSAKIPVLRDGKVTYRYVAIVAANPGSPLAVTLSPNGESYTITHLPSGRNIPVHHGDVGELIVLLKQLEQLDWAGFSGEAPEEPITSQTYALLNAWLDVYQVPTWWEIISWWWQGLVGQRP
jgi:hypothetical protein